MECMCIVDGFPYLGPNIQRNFEIVSTHYTGRDFSIANLVTREVLPYPYLDVPCSSTSYKSISMIIFKFQLWPEIRESRE
jgi:hypothetical protein